MRPLIGILANKLIMEGGMFPGIERAYVNNDYVEAVLEAGGVPVLIPINTDVEAIRRQIEAMDGIVISGGYDVNPMCYGEEPTDKQGFTFPEIDEFDLEAVKYANELNKPMLGICRGLQIMNVAFGGTLYQDMSFNKEACVKHTQSAKRNDPTHTVETVKGTILNSILGDTNCINSFHHQSVKKVAEGFKVSAHAKDNVVEAIEMENKGFVVGVQWHPEMMVKNSEAMLNIFKTLVKESIKK